MKTTYVKSAKLSWPDLWNNLGMSKDNVGRWYPGDDTPKYVRDYLSGYRSPSRAHPNSYATALLTGKFAKHMSEIDPELAVKLNVATEIEAFA